MKQREQWEVVSYPAAAESDDILGRVEGEPLCPTWYDADDLETIKNELGNKWWSALYQQRPVPDGGNIFKASWFKYWQALPNLSGLYQFWDTAFEDSNTAAYSVGQTWGEAENGYYLIDQYRDRVEYPDLKRAITSQAVKYAPRAIVIEYKASGSSVVQDLRRDTRFPIIGQAVKQASKEVRAELVSPIVESGRVFLPEGAHYLSDLIYELTHFPAAATADQVDALTMALDYFTQKSGRTISGAKIFGGR